MGIFSKNKKEELPPINITPNMEVCNKIFNEMCDVMYRDKRTLVELEIILGMLQNEIIMNKTHNAIMSQVGRLAFVPPMLPPELLTGLEDESKPETVEKPSSKAQHYQ